MQTSTHVTKAKKVLKAVKKPKMATKMQSASGSLKATLGSIQELIENQPDLKNSIKEVIDTEKRIYDAGSKQVSDLAKYLKSNWKLVVPALAALGVGAHFLGKSPKGKKLTK